MNTIRKEIGDKILEFINKMQMQVSYESDVPLSFQQQMQQGALQIRNQHRPACVP